MVGQQQKISIGKGCESKGIVQHEILHALGRVHEQSRPDRDSYVTIHQNNIEKGAKFCLLIIGQPVTLYSSS